MYRLAGRLSFFFSGYSGLLPPSSGTFKTKNKKSIPIYVIIIIVIIIIIIIIIIQ